MNVSNNDTEAILLLENYYKDVRSFKNFFIKNCSVDKKYEAYKVWAHWLIRNLCEVQDNYHMIPNQSILNDPDIINHLIDKGANPNKVNDFYQEVITRVDRLYTQYHQFKVELFQNKRLISVISQITERSTENENDMLYHSFKINETYIKHNDVKYQKLVSQYTGPPTDLNFYLFEVGFNYYILDGHSLQWCIPPKVFEILEQKLNVKTELFASPTNSILPMYCSLFYADRQFGALDNFFNLDVSQILEGTFEVNPPFIESVFIRSSKMVVDFLNQSANNNKDLLFIYVMPNWLDSQGYHMLAGSQYLIDEIVFKPNKHFYYQCTNERMVLANFESHILIVGTPIAKERWTTKIKNDVIRNFCYYERTTPKTS